MTGDVNDGFEDFVNGSHTVEVPAERTPVKT